MFDQWLERHRTQCVAKYIELRRHQGDERPEEVIHSLAQVLYSTLMRAIAGDEGWQHEALLRTTEALQTGLSTQSIVAQASRDLYGAVKQVLLEVSPPEVLSWLALLGDYCLQGDQLAFAILEQSLSAQKSLQENLYKISRNLNQAHTPAELLDILAQPAIEVGVAEADLMYIDVDENGEVEWLEKVAAWHHAGTPATPIGTRYYLPEFALTKVIHQHPNEVQLITASQVDASADPTLHQLLERLRAKSSVLAPLVHAGRWVGLLCLHWYEEHDFSESEKAIYQAYPGLASSALEGQRLLAELEARVEKQTQALRESLERERQAKVEHAQLQQDLIDVQQQAIRELSTPVIPVMDRIIVMPLVGNIDAERARDIMRVLLTGIREHRAKIVILDVTGVPMMDSVVVGHINKTIQAARLKGAHTIVTGLSDAVAETIVDLGIDWSEVTALADLQTGLIHALSSMGLVLREATNA